MLLVIAVLLAGCANTGSPSDVDLEPMASHLSHNSATHADHGHINGWLDGEDVSLFYTRSFFCEEPPASGAATGCVLGADAEVFPRGGPIPTIYAVAPVGFAPDPATLSCRAGTPCLNHPATVNIRVFDANVWNEIAASKSLERIRELRADAAVGGAGRISADTPTNIFFFISVQPDHANK